MSDASLRQDMHLSQLVRHFECFDVRQRRRIAGLYGAPGHTAPELARHLCEAPDRIREVVEREAGETDAWRLLSELCFDHDITIDVTWASVSAR